MCSSDLPDIGAATGTSLALNGATLGTNKLAVSGTTLLGGATTVSTGALTLGVQQTTQGTLVLANTAAGSYSVTLQSSNSATATATYTLPPAPPASNNYVLASSTAGVMSWVDNATGLVINSSTITGGTSGRFLYDNAGTVGEPSAITTDGTAALTLGTQQTTQGSLVLANTAAGSYSTTLKASNSASAAWTFTFPTTAGTSGYALITDGSGNTSWSDITGLTGVLTTAHGGTGTSTNFTAGSIVFAGATGAYAQNNSKFFWDNTNFRLGINTATPAVTIDITATDAIRVPVGNGTTERPTGVTGYIRYNTDTGKFEGYGASSWGNIGCGAAITDDTTTSSNLYPTFTSATTGDLTAVYVSSTKLTYKPSTGDLQSVGVGASSGVLTNSNNITVSYSIPSNYNGISSGPITIAAGATITVPAGSNWTVV